MTDTGRAEVSTNYLFVDALDPRSAAHLVRWTAGLQARIKARMVNEAGERVGEETAFVCAPPSPGAFLRLAALRVRPCERVEITAEGPDAQEAIRRVEKALSSEEQAPPVDVELERALRWWVAVCADPNPSEEMQVKIRELVDDHIQHAIY